MADAGNPEPPEAGPNQAPLEIVKYHVNFKPSQESHEWLGLPEIPTSEELSPNFDDPDQVHKILSVLLPNTVEVPWTDKNLYLETHYRLQREESITMLRYSINKFKLNPSMEDDKDTCIYTKIFIQGYLMTRLGPMCRVAFSPERATKRIRWNQTRRLTQGTLVALSTAKDRFRTLCIPAVIANPVVHDSLENRPPTVQLFWGNTEDAVMDPSVELIMIESRVGYFESTRHTMVGLQQAAETASPLDKYLVEADKCDLHADFVARKPEMNLSSLVHHVPEGASISKMEAVKKRKEVKDSFRAYPILRNIDDRLSKYTNLDNSQLTAVQRILTKELSIIQGPPGTGKTFTSVQSLQILLQSQGKGSNPIVVAAQTNHAVDQILMHLAELGYQIVRLGGRTRNENMKQFSMYNLRRRTFQRIAQKSDRDRKNAEGARRKNIASLQSLIHQVCPDEVVDPDELLEAGIITQEQYDSLTADDEWVNSLPPDFPVGIVAQWLGPEQLVKPTSVDYKEPLFVAEDEDNGEEGIWEEMVDTRDYDVELDDHTGDDEAERMAIKGTFVPISHTWTGRNDQGYSSNDVRIRKEMKRPNLWSIDTKFRGAVYRSWQAQLLERRSTQFRKILADNKRITDNLKISRWYQDTETIRNSQIEIVGCTTTGLTKYRGLLAALQPRTMLIEEAAETREANIISAIYPSLQQLILVGDHQQLVPHCDTRGLGEKPYNLRVSLFERLVKLEMPFTMLNMQRRMIPSLRKILNEFYPSLQDHPVVTKPKARLPVPGMATESYLFHHTWSEASDEDMSRFNILETEMVMGFIHYLRLNGVHDSQITVLTFYRGQRKKILAEGRRKLFHARPFTNVYTVDSYQGEENDIVILSLVRSHGPDKQAQAGFLADQNRGVVSISRARRGFYIFGNIKNLLEAGPESRQMWGKVDRVFKSQGRLGQDGRLPITCQKHGKTVYMSHPEDWIMNHGGCDQPCEENLRCGHACERRCHPVPHDLLVCQKPCERLLRCGHRCQQVCGKECSCDCFTFTGAYPHDEFKKKASPIRPHQRGRGSLAGYPMSRFDHTSARDTGKWASYNPRADDAKMRQNSPQHAFESFPLIDISNEPTSITPNNGGTILHETFRPVTLTTDGERLVGGGIVSTSSPEKHETHGNERALAPREDEVVTQHSEVNTQGYSLSPSRGVHNETGTDDCSARSSPVNDFDHMGRDSDLGSADINSYDRYSRYDTFSLLDEDIQDPPDYVTTRSYSPGSIQPEYPSGIRERNRRLRENLGVEEVDTSEPLIEL